MVDKIGRTSNPGDEVIFIANATTKPEIEFGIVKRIHLNARNAAYNVKTESVHMFI